MKGQKTGGRLWFLMILALLIGICVGIAGYVRFHAPKEPELTSSYISGRLEAVSELTTAALTYTGLIKYSEGNIPFLTQNSFSMIYTARIRAGIDLSEAKIDIQEERVVITLPECEIQSVEVDENSIEFYDERWALFNRTTKEDVINTVAAAKEDVSQKADLESLLQHARLQTETIVREFLRETVGDRELVIQ